MSKKLYAVCEYSTYQATSTPHVISLLSFTFVIEVHRIVHHGIAPMHHLYTSLKQDLKTIDHLQPYTPLLMLRGAKQLHLQTKLQWIQHCCLLSLCASVHDSKLRVCTIVLHTIQTLYYHRYILLEVQSVLIESVIQ